MSLGSPLGFAHTVRKVSSPSADPVPYETLSDAKRAAFDEALGVGRVAFPNPNKRLDDVAYERGERWYVVLDGTVYEFRTSVVDDAHRKVRREVPFGLPSFGPFRHLRRSESGEKLTR